LRKLVFSDNEVTVTFKLRVDIEPCKSGFRDTLGVPSGGASFDGTFAGGSRSIDSNVVSDAWEGDADCEAREVPSPRVDTTGPCPGVATSVDSDSNVATDVWEGDADCGILWREGITVATSGAYAGDAAVSVDGDVVSHGWESDGSCEFP
jgi:hypothetical protein